MAEGKRTREVEIITDEIEATRHALDLGREGDVIVVCVDHANDVWKELQRRQHGRASEPSEALRAVTGIDDDLDEAEPV
jgi:cyanophycin synthetase